MLANFQLSSITGLGLLLFCGYFCGQLARYLKLPALIGYLAAGILLGSSILDVLSKTQLHQLEFVTSIALGCISFIIGSELQLAALKKLGAGIIVIIFTQLLLAFLVVAGAVFWLTKDPVLSLLFGAIAPASAPAGTVAIIQEYKAKGPLTKALYAVVGFDDGLAVILFGFVLAGVKVLLSDDAMAGSPSVTAIILAPLREIGFSLLLGAVIGFIFSLIVRRTTHKADRLVLIFWAVLTGVGLSGRWHLSLILVCMTVGFSFVNTNKAYLTRDTREPMQHIMGPIFVLFFGLAGLHLNLSTLPALSLLGLTYIMARIMGKLLGVWLGAECCRMEKKFSRYLGFGILSQAGVAIGFALLIQQELASISGTEMLGIQILSTITATSIVFEIIGPLAARYALMKAGEIKGK